MEKRRCQAAAAPQEELLSAGCRVGDSPSFSTCATISETARELCKAVSVSLGLATESSDAGEMDAALPPCAAGDQIRGDYLFGAVTPNCPGAQAAVGEYRCPDADERSLHGRRQLVEVFKSSEHPAPGFHLASARTSGDPHNFALCDADDVHAREVHNLDAARGASCTYVPSAPDNLAHFGQTPAAERPCRLYKARDEARDFGEVAESKFGRYEAPQCGVKLKREDGDAEGAMWGGSYTFNDKYNTQFWASRQCVNPSGAGTSAAFVCNPYERSVRRPEQWYPGGMLRPPYGGSTYMKAEVGEWVDVTFNDARYVNNDHDTRFRPYCHCEPVMS